MEETKKCPACAEEIKKEAKKCPKCQKDLGNWFVRHWVISILLFLFI
jgi:predicted amidophosphoribosyltransferase